MARLRRILVSVHKWIGLCLAVFLLLQAVSGALLIYRAEIVDALAGSGTSVSEVHIPHASLSFILASGQQHYPGRDVTRVDFPRRQGGVYLLHLKDRHSGAVTHAVMEPASATFSEPAVAKIMHWLFEWHHEFFAGRVGTWFVGAMGVLLVTSVITGVVIWWPGLRRLAPGLRVSVKGPAARTLFELHRTIGALAAAGLLLAATTGAILAFGPILRPAFGVASVTPAAPVDVRATALAPDKLLALAEREFPGSRVRDVRFGQPGNRLQRVVMHRAGDAGAKPPHQVWLDPYQGVVTARQDSRAMAANETFFAWMYPLHTQYALSGAGRVLALLSGLALIGLTVLGILLWAKRRSIRRARAVRAANRQRGETQNA